MSCLLSEKNKRYWIFGRMGACDCRSSSSCHSSSISSSTRRCRVRLVTVRLFADAARSVPSRLRSSALIDEFRVRSLAPSLGSFRSLADHSVGDGGEDDDGDCACASVISCGAMHSRRQPSPANRSDGSKMTSSDGRQSLLATNISNIRFAHLM